MRHSSEISPKNFSHPHISSFSMQGSANYDSKTLTPSRNSYINLKQVKPKTSQKSSKSIKIPLKPNLCDSKSSSGLILPIKKRPPTGNQLKGKLKILKDKTMRSFNNQNEEKTEKKFEDLSKTANCEDKNSEEIAVKFNEDCKLINKTKHKKSISLNLELTNHSNKILSDPRQYPKPLKTTKNAKLKSKKLFGSSKKLEKNGTSLFNSKAKPSSINILDVPIEGVFFTKNSIGPKIYLNKPKSKVNISLSPKFSQKKFQPSGKEPKKVKGIIRASKFTCNKSDLDKNLNGVIKSPNDSNKSSVIPTETDEWVNFIDYKFQGSTSRFVEEFKAKILEDILLMPNHALNEGIIHSQLGTTENLYTEDLDLSPSDSISYEKPKKNSIDMASTKNQQIFIPKLALNEIITQDSPSFLYDTLNEANCTSEMLEGNLENSYYEIGNTKSDYFFISSTKDGSPNDGQIDFVEFRTKGR